MKEYVVGFLFNEPHRHVVLIRKNRPQWQAGKLNGVGGKVEPSESPYQAMVREFEEETGVLWAEWEQFATLTGDDASYVNGGGTFVIHFFKAFTHEPLHELVETRTDEAVEVVSLDAEFVDPFVVPNLAWLIPMALHQTVRFVVKEVSAA